MSILLPSTKIVCNNPLLFFEYTYSFDNQNFRRRIPHLSSEQVEVCPDFLIYFTFRLNWIDTRPVLTQPVSCRPFDPRESDEGLIVLVHIHLLAHLFGSRCIFGGKPGVTFPHVVRAT
ncbi:hypothetical protein AVEN_34592-1 [Araneus ventricosus]|uniref:Uncharacterized protein n=1 Tax=Araneus ventricosus TaxID=182803 RepID=A0A4Y2AZ81_ARAVE|nr:hypothetical protein AVEN_34592-1 [Araneus ventricosus]